MTERTFTATQVRQKADFYRGRRLQGFGVVVAMLDAFADRLEDEEPREPFIPDGMVEVAPGLAMSTEPLSVTIDFGAGDDDNGEEWHQIAFDEDVRAAILGGDVVTLAPARPGYRVEVDRTFMRWRYVRVESAKSIDHPDHDPEAQP